MEPSRLAEDAPALRSAQASSDRSRIARYRLQSTIVLWIALRSIYSESTAGLSLELKCPNRLGVQSRSLPNRPGRRSTVRMGQFFGRDYRNPYSRQGRI